MDTIPPGYERVALLLPTDLLNRLKPDAVGTTWRRGTLDREIEYRLEHSLEQGKPIQRQMYISLGWHNGDRSVRLKIDREVVADWFARALSPQEAAEGKHHFLVSTGLKRPGSTPNTYQVATFEEVVSLVREDLQRIMFQWVAFQTTLGNKTAVEESILIDAAIRRLLFKYMEERRARLPVEQPTIAETINI